MSFALPRPILIGALALSLGQIASGCGSAPEKSDRTEDSALVLPSDTENGGAAGSDGGTGGVESDQTSSETLFDPDTVLSFGESGPLELLASEVVELSLSISPPRRYSVKLDLVGPALDASLEASTVETDADGHAHFSVTASSTAASFQVRASLNDKLLTTLSVKVEEVPTAKLRVAGSYTGTRDIEAWTIGVTPGTSCAELQANQGLNAATLAVNASTLPVLVEQVPISLPLALMVRGDALVSGCVDLAPLTPDQQRDVTVPLLDLPLLLTDVLLPVSLDGDGSLGFEDGVGDSLPTLLEAFADGGARDMSALLDTMLASTSPVQRQELSQLRSQQLWDSRLSERFATEGEQPLRSWLRLWIEEGVSALTGASAIDMMLSLSPTEGVPSLSVGAVAGQLPSRCGMNEQAALSLATETGDRLVWSSTLNFDAGQILACLGESVAFVDVPEATTVPRALDLSLDCAAVGGVLTEAGANTGNVSATCGVACLATLCQQALEVMWNRGVSAAGGAPRATLTVSAAGELSISPEARPEAMTGSWVGQLTTPITSVSVSGLLSAP